MELEDSDSSSSEVDPSEEDDDEESSFFSEASFPFEPILLDFFFGDGFFEDEEDALANEEDFPFTPFFPEGLAVFMTCFFPFSFFFAGWPSDESGPGIGTQKKTRIVDRVRRKGKGNQLFGGSVLVTKS